MKKIFVVLVAMLLLVIIACSGGSDSPAPATVPTAPTGLTATSGNAHATIAWAAVADATSYNIYWSTTTGVTTANGTRITGATNPYIHTGLTNGTTYYYVVTGVNSVGESEASSEANCNPVAPVPTF